MKTVFCNQLYHIRHKGPSEAITSEDIEHPSPEIQEGDIVVLNTGWHEKWGDTANI